MTVPTITRGSFSGHETFPLRYTWLQKAVRETKDDHGVFGREDAMVRFGVGKNMVGAIHHWGLTSTILEEDPDVQNNRGRALRPSPLGGRLFGPGGWDVFLEDPGTLWLLHWHIASNHEWATTWYWAFSHLPRPEFSRTELQGWLLGLIEQKGWTRVSEASLARDIDCFIRTYLPARTNRSSPLEDTLECPLVELGLIREFGSRGNYLLARGEQQTLTDEIFAYGLVDFLGSMNLSTGTVPLEKVAFAPGSPGRIFCLSEESLIHRLDRIRALTDGALSLDETAGLRQVLVRRLPDPMDLLSHHYAPPGTTRKRDHSAIARAGH